MGYTFENTRAAAASAAAAAAADESNTHFKNQKPAAHTAN